MKKIISLAVVVAALAVPAIASAHDAGFSVSGSCNEQTGKYDLVWTVTSSNTNLAPKISASNRASIPVNAPLGATTTFNESIAGTSTSVSAAITVKWSDNFTQAKTASKTFSGECAPPREDPKCPEGYTEAGTSEGVLLCTKETVREVPVEKIVEVPTTITQYVDRVVEVAKEVPGPTTTVEKIVYKTKVVNHIKYRIKQVYRTKRVIVRVCPIKRNVEPPLAG